MTAVVVVAVSEIAKRSTVLAALIASLPLTSLLAFVWLYLDTADTERVAALSQDIFWLVLPSLVLFVLLTALLRAGWPFWSGFAVACVGTSAAYAAATWLLHRFHAAG